MQQFNDDTCPCCAARAQAQTAARVANARAADLEKQLDAVRDGLNAERKAHELTRRELKAMERTANAIADERVGLANEVFSLQRQLAEAQSAGAEETR